MTNPFINSDSAKRYHTYDYALRARYGRKAVRVALSGGFTCPNRDGTKGVDGCAFCSGAGSGDFAGDACAPLARQFQEGRARTREKWRDAGITAYFQSFSGTYAPVERLRALYEVALEQPGVVGISIATRADCITPECEELLSTMARRTDLSVELGLQSAFDTTTAALNCAHTLMQFCSAYERLRLRGIPVCAHIINGLPGESHEMMMQTARVLASLRVQAVKIHLLYVLRGTALGEAYERGEYALMERGAYVEVVCDQLEVLPPETVIQRLTGDGPRALLLGPQWSRDKRRVLGDIDKELLRRDSWQGKYFAGAPAADRL